MVFFTIAPKPDTPSTSDDTHLTSNCKNLTGCSPGSTSNGESPGKRTFYAHDHWRIRPSLLG
jgi:hypothetical protein